MRHPTATSQGGASFRATLDGLLRWGEEIGWCRHLNPNGLHFSHRICVKTTGTPAGMGPSLRLEPGIADEIQLPGAVGRFLPAAGRVVAQGRAAGGLVFLGELG